MMIGEKRKSDYDNDNSYIHPSSSSSTTDAKNDDNVSSFNLDEKYHCLIGIDIGTQGAKAILYHPQSQSIKARSSFQYDLDTNTNNDSDNGRAEQHPIKWIQALHKLLIDLSIVINKENYIIQGIGVSGQQHGMVVLDEKFNIIRKAKLWCDVEAVEQSKLFSQQATDIMGKSWNIPPGFTAPKVLWMKEKEIDNWNKMKWIVLPHDYINLCLRTGIGHDINLDNNVEVSSIENHCMDVDKSIIPTTDAGDASGSGIFNPTSRDYVKDLANIIDDAYFPALPKILSASDICGHLSPYWKKAVNIDILDSKPIPISVGSGDNMMSALGCQCVSPGNAVLSLGTSGTIFGVSLTPVETGTSVAPFCDATGKHLPLVCTMSCTGVLNSVLESWCSKSTDKAMSHSEATKLAEQIPPGCNGLTFLPYLGGERTPNWPHATGALLGINAQNIDCMSGGSPGLVYRAAMEGITFVLAEALNEMRKSCGDGFNPIQLLVVGGGSKNEFWRQMISDILDLELKFPLEPESAALGAAFQAGSAASGVSVDQYVLRQKLAMEDVVVKPTQDNEVKRLYKEAFDRFSTMSKKLFD